MSTHRSLRIGKGDAERMLRGGPVDAKAGPDPLADLLAAAAAPARAGELAGEEAAMAAFREARLVPVAQTRRDSMIKIGLAKLVTVKVAAVAVAATTVGGVAVAASTGVLPSPGASDSSVQLTTSASAHATAPSVHSPNARASVSASLVGLCHAYTAGAGDNPGKALDAPSFTVLITAAGGKDKVTAYCTAVLNADLAAADSAHPTGTPTTEPHGESANHARGTATGDVGNDTTGADGQVGVGSSVDATVAPGTQVGATVAPKAGLEATAAPGAHLGATGKVTETG
ncbi:hypothetical protein, partial [Frankia sp. Cppng1_Ct_nod]|uniref:hypothetical protein n=1 Tax=Frankia sp. Cppng1_Ct_nod TaxID=2897162 RepID=UPI0010411877